MYLTTLLVISETNVWEFGMFVMFYTFVLPCCPGIHPCVGISRRVTTVVFSLNLDLSREMQ